MTNNKRAFVSCLVLAAVLPFLSWVLSALGVPCRSLLDGEGLSEAALLPDALRETLERLGGLARTERDEDGLHLTYTLPAGRAPFAVKEAGSP